LKQVYHVSMIIEIQSIDRTQFMVHPHTLNNEVVWLVQPNHIGCSWKPNNIHFRSSVWDSNGNPVSLSFPKFPNLFEKPDVFPVPTNLKNAVITEKLDGSCLIVSKWRGVFILRTRGTVDATVLENGHELEIFKEKYLPILDKSCNNADTWDTSFLFEWLTASKDHTIVIKYDNVPEWVLTGAINHEDYSLYQQNVLDAFAKFSGFKRPETYTFDSVDELIDKVTDWKNAEGVVLYTNNGQTLHKVKSDDYKKKHAFKSNATLENTLDLFLTFGKPDYNEFKTKIGELYDWECVQMVTGHISNILDANKEVQKIINGMDRFVNDSVKTLPNRKEQAMKILSSYGTGSNRSGMVFTLLDGKCLTKEQELKLFWQVLKK
jgi:hypothetical protein